MISAVTSLGLFEDFLGRILVAVSSGPALQLLLCPSAEFHKFLPVLLHEIKDPGNGILLLLIGISQRRPGNMAMQAAGSGIVGGLAHAL